MLRFKRGDVVKYISPYVGKLCPEGTTATETGTGTALEPVLAGAMAGAGSARVSRVDRRNETCF